MPKLNSLTKSKPLEQGSKMPQDQLEMLILKALELTVRHKPLSPEIQQALPPELLQALLQTLEYQSKREQLGRFRTLPPRLADLVERLYQRGIMSRPVKDDPLDYLDPSQRKRQLASEALELRRQEAIRTLNARDLLAKGSQQTA